MEGTRADVHLRGKLDLKLQLKEAMKLGGKMNCLTEQNCTVCPGVCPLTKNGIVVQKLLCFPQISPASTFPLHLGM